MTIVGTRPEIIKLSRVIAELEQHTEHILVHTGQNYDYELNEIFFNDLNVKKPDYFLDSVGDTTASTIGNIISKSDKLIGEVKPDAILLYGDTNSCLSVISAKKQQVPIFHMEAGNRCFDQRVPEELNRKIVDHLSDINMPLTEQARDYLISEGIRPETVIKIGSCMKEILSFYESEISNSKILKQLKLTKNKFFVVSAHREENVDYKDNLMNLIHSLNKVAEQYKLPVIVSTHPRTQNRMNQISSEIDITPSVKFLKPVGFFDYIKLQQNSFCVISDSGTISEESSILSFPAVMIRKAHERPECMDEGTLIMSGLKSERIIESINVVTKQHKKNAPQIIRDYDLENVSVKVTRIILSYIDYINRNVWKKGESTRTFR